MPSRRRHTPARGRENRIAYGAERVAVSIADAAIALGVAASRPFRRPPAPLPLEKDRAWHVLVLRLDRIGDVTMTLPALSDLRAAWPRARIRLAAGRWSAPIAKRAPVDEVLEWNAPWVGRRAEGADTWSQLIRKARGLAPPDVAIDLSCDPRANLLLWLSRASVRIGYANGGLGSLLTHALPFDETVSWLEESRLAVERVCGTARSGTLALVTGAERLAARQRLVDRGASASGPIVVVHPSGGRPIKQWSLEKWSEVARRLRDAYGATIVVTGSAADAALAHPILAAVGAGACDLTGRLSLDETLGLVSAVDLFLSPDTGPMHLACAVDTPSVTVFGPSDPRRYFSGGSGAPGTRHVVVRKDLWCSPCNLIRRPPRECLYPSGPECLSLVTVDDVFAEAARLLDAAGFRQVWP